MACHAPQPDVERLCPNRIRRRAFSRHISRYCRDAFSKRSDERGSNAQFSRYRHQTLAQLSHRPLQYRHFSEVIAQWPLLPLRDLLVQKRDPQDREWSAAGAGLIAPGSRTRRSRELGLSLSIQSSRHSGKSVDWTRSAPRQSASSDPPQTRDGILSRDAHEVRHFFHTARVSSGRCNSAKLRLLIRGKPTGYRAAADPRTDMWNGSG
jgi:hypothetical protein